MDEKGTGVGDDVKKIIKKTILRSPITWYIIGGVSLFVVLLLIVGQIVEPIYNMFSEDTVDEKLEKAQEKFKKNINEVADDIDRKNNVKIDRALLVSAVLYGGDYETLYDDSLLEDDADIDKYFTDSENVNFPEIIKLGAAKAWIWWQDNISGKSVTFKGIQLKRFKVSKHTMRIVSLAMINDAGKVDLKYFRTKLTEKIVPWMHSEFIKGSTTAKSITEDIFSMAEMYRPWFERKKKKSCSPGGDCIYNLNGQDLSNVKVRLMKCADEGRGNPIEGEELVDFEKYILGVTYAEIGAESPGEAQKSEAIAARSYALVRPTAMGNSAGVSLEEQNGQWILSLRNCTEDQVYCDPDKGCYASGNNTGNTVHSGSNGGKQYKGPLEPDAPIRSAVSGTRGKLLLNSAGNVVNTSYVDSDQQAWIRMANNGKDHTEILIEHYNSVRPYDASTIGLSNCSDTGGGKDCTTSAATGPYAAWKQCDPTWGSIRLGRDTICSIGCASTSIAIQIARSGVTTGIDNFNPGTFVQALTNIGGYTGGGAIYWGKVADLIPNFAYIKKVGLAGNVASSIQSLIDEGCYVILSVRNGGHWVAVDRIEGDQILIMDPAGEIPEASAHYGAGTMNEALCYKKV